MTNRQLLLGATLLLVAACGDDGNNNPVPDAPPGGDDASTCGATLGEITTYPGTFMGTVKGGGADLNVTDGLCTVQAEDFFFDEVGEDVVVRLAGLTVGSKYAIDLQTEEDLGFYVTTSCPAMSGIVTGCVLFADATTGGETGLFTATATEHFLVVDTGDDPMPPATGTFTVNVAPAQCEEATEATDCSGATPYCVDFTCVECTSPFDCDAASPVCGATNSCEAGPMMCTGDDVNDTTAPGDDGPAAATMINAPGVGTPTVQMGGICNTPTSEQDWYKVTLPANDIGIELTFTGATNDLDVYLLTSTGSVLVSGESNAGINEAIKTTNLAAGDYYVVVTQFRPSNTVAVVPYTLTLRRTECANDFQCLVATAPVCGPSGVCGAGPALCASDDAGDTGVADDGPAAARTLVSGVAQTGSVCSSPSSEADFYKVVVANGQGVTVALDWTGTTDLDPTIYDSTGVAHGFSFYTQPENVALTYLPAGTYYIKVVNFAQTASTVVQAYTITATTTAAQTCTTNVQCAASYSTQLYRGDCQTATGTCHFIAPGTRAAGAACDSGTDCQSMRCSYIAFDADAQDSVCTTTCTTSADCAAVGANMTCLSGLQTNFCVPSCASDLECGADTGSGTVDAGQPWDYLTCAVGTGVCSI